MRALGAFTVVSAFLLAVSSSLREKRERLHCLREICEALKLLQGELESCPRPLPELLQILAPSLYGAGKSFFQCVSAGVPRLGDLSLAEIWGQAVAQCCAPLRKEEKQRLVCLGLVLGRYDLAAQLRELAACLGVLESREREAAGLYPAQRRLQLGLALSTGAILAILLL